MCDKIGAEVPSKTGGIGVCCEPACPHAIPVVADWTGDGEQNAPSTGHSHQRLRQLPGNGAFVSHTHTHPYTLTHTHTHTHQIRATDRLHDQVFSPQSIVYLTPDSDTSTLLNTHSLSLSLSLSHTTHTLDRADAYLALPLALYIDLEEVEATKVYVVGGIVDLTINKVC